jgi:hypothetical protein
MGATDDSIQHARLGIYWIGKVGAIESSGGQWVEGLERRSRET